LANMDMDSVMGLILTTDTAILKRRIYKE
jgi:hypothetical protein